MSNDGLDAPPGPAPTLPSTDWLSAEDLVALNSRRGFQLLMKERKIDLHKVVQILRYEAELQLLQTELIKLQRSVQTSGRRVAILFEGRDAAGKGGAIRRFTEHMYPRSMRVVALDKPSELQRGQWYFQRYVEQLPNPGEIVFFDRSWYNRAVVEPVNGFCTQQQYETFLQQVPEFEHMLYEDGMELIKFWFSIAKDQQQARFDERRKNPLKQWKLSPVDDRAQDLWDAYTTYKEAMLARTHTSYAPWTVVKADDKKKARLESIRYVLGALPYDGKQEAIDNLYPDPDIVMRFHRSGHRND